jgi:hypothetical protein
MPGDPPNSSLVWDFESAIRLYQSSIQLPIADDPPPPGVDAETHDVALSYIPPPDEIPSLGDFTQVWDLLRQQATLGVGDDDYAMTQEGPLTQQRSTENDTHNDDGYENVDPEAKDLSQNDPRAVRWRDEDGADLEDNIEPAQPTAASLRTQKRAARRARARERAEREAAKSGSSSDADSGDALESLRRSPDRRSVIDNVLGLKRPGTRDHSSPPTSPSPPKATTTPIRQWPISQPFLWTAPGVPSPSHRIVLAPKDGLSALQRKQALIKKLREHHSEEARFLKNKGLVSPEFTALNTSDIGIHVFIDMSNISIGFHDCLKVARGLPQETRVKRIPLSFHNLSLILERGRPAHKRVLAGSDVTPAIEEAKALGYEANILDRVHKVKEPTPRQMKFASRSAGETSGSETNTWTTPRRAERWVEQGVDELLHLKILMSLADSKRPSTIVLATGDAAEAEYSDGFLKMAERMLEKGWMVELVSFKLNTSSFYRRKEFRTKWGSMFKWIQLDDYVEMLIDEE